MKSNLEIEVKNLGPIEKATINLNKINIIGGINGSGKTTLSKLLYCYIAANTLEGDYLTNHRIKEIFQEFIRYWSRSLENEETPHNYIILQSFLNEWDNQDSSYAYFQKYFLDLKEFIQNTKLKNNKECIERLNYIEKVINALKDPVVKYYEVVNFLLSTEYDLFQLQEYSDAKVIFKGKFEEKTFTQSTDFKKDRMTSNFEGYSDCINFREMIYIDSPSILDLYNNNHPYHYNFLYTNITNKQNKKYDEIYNEKISGFEKKLEDIMGGNFNYDIQKEQFFFKQEKNIEIEMKNTSSGFKQLGIIQLLLSSKTLTSNSFIVIDEPEINLHPDFQIKLAEILVLMSKELNIVLYINSHSPQFIEALELYTAKYDLINETSFYINEKSDNSKYCYKQIERNELSILYDNLGKAYDILDSIRADNINQGKF